VNWLPTDPIDTTPTDAAATGNGTAVAHESMFDVDRGCYGETKGLIAPKIPTSGDKVN